MQATTTTSIHKVRRDALGGKRGDGHRSRWTPITRPDPRRVHIGRCDPSLTGYVETPEEPAAVFPRPVLVEDRDRRELVGRGARWGGPGHWVWPRRIGQSVGHCRRRAVLRGGSHEHPVPAPQLRRVGRAPRAVGFDRRVRGCGGARGGGLRPPPRGVRGISARRRTAAR